MSGQVTIQELLQMIGEQQVQIALLNREVARLQALIPKEEAPGPRPVAVER